MNKIGTVLGVIIAAAIAVAALYLLVLLCYMVTRLVIFG